MDAISPNRDSSKSSSSESGLSDNDGPPTSHDMVTSGVPSNDASASPTTNRLLALAVPGREDLVVMVNTSDLCMPVIERPASDLNLVPSPENQFIYRDESTPPDERLCTRLWVLWAGLTFPLVLSSWLLLVPFLVGNKDSVLTERPLFPWVKTPGVPITSPTTVRPTVATPSTTPASAGFSWQGMPPSCLSPVAPPTEPVSYKIGAYPSTVASTDRIQRPIFCLFDNAKVTTAGTSPQTSDYMFETLPFALCPNVVYASVGIVDGHLTRRLPRFEQSHGLPLLRKIVQTRGYQDTRILLVLGGREQDAPHFWRLGRDPLTLDLLMRNVADGMRSYQLDGVVVHWVAPSAYCSGTDRDMVLSILLHRLNKTFANYGMTRHVVSVMLDMDVRNQYLLESVVDVVDYFFIGTNALRYTGRGPYQDMCANLSHATRVVIHSYAQVAVSVRMDQLCIMQELAPWVVQGFEMPNGSWVLSSGDHPTKAPLYSACTRADFCRKDPGGASCIAHLTYPAPANPAGRPAALFLVPNTDSLRLLNFSGIPAFAPSTTVHACVLVLDLHRDNYARQCVQFLEYVLMEHFYTGTIGQRRPRQSIIDGASLCQVPGFG
ncbi:hypothetical protein HPB51_028637 [Rhipicephalus microplus]|uniref:Uncharacterized protein n=1 Tax=Rhipicephalus microplus TaxID=6941 RepID=A0A9J6CWZ6_RHIMP|nr:hypothetical protein HPB51_028637 [Rhipicephalus microplus]